MPGTCGELVQGIIDGEHFHITCPVDLFSQVSIIKRGDEKKRNPSNAGKTICPQDKWKAKLALDETLNFFSTNFGCEIYIKSNIPTGKGMASSSADITGVVYGVAEILGKEISSNDIAKIALSIEPTDGIMFKDIVLFGQRNGKVLRYLGSPPEIKILIIDLGESIDTLTFNKIRFNKNSKNEKKIREAVDLVTQGIKYKDIYKIGKGATLSARCNQTLLYKSELEAILQISMKMGAVGVNVAHSGTVIGVLLPENFYDFKILKNKIEEKFQRRYKFYQTELIEGGARR